MGIDVPEFLAERGMEKNATEMVKAVGDCAIIAFYYLIRVAEYTVKKHRNETNQTVQFKFEDTMFFCQDAKGEIFSVDGATLKMDNKKMDGEECVFIKNTMEMKSSSR